jgi:hypothetical protein
MSNLFVASSLPLTVDFFCGATYCLYYLFGYCLLSVTNHSFVPFKYNLKIEETKSFLYVDFLYGTNFLNNDNLSSRNNCWQILLDFCDYICCFFPIIFIFLSLIEHRVWHLLGNTSTIELYSLLRVFHFSRKHMFLKRNYF